MSRLEGLNGTLDKFQRTFLVLSALTSLDICLTRERSIKPKMGCHVSSTVGNIGKKVFIDLDQNSEKEPLFVDSARRIHKICKCLSNLQYRGLHHGKSFNLKTLVCLVYLIKYT